MYFDFFDIRGPYKKLQKWMWELYLLQISLFKTFISVMFEGGEEPQCVRFNPKYNTPIHTALLSRSVSHRRALSRDV
jgi:hypothetical protein